MFDPDKYTDGRLLAATLLGLIEMVKNEEGDEEILHLLIEKMQDFFSSHSPAITAKTNKIAIDCPYRKQVVYALNNVNRFLKSIGYDVAITWREGHGYQWRARKENKTYRSHYKYADKGEDMSY